MRHPARHALCWERRREGRGRPPKPPLPCPRSHAPAPNLAALPWRLRKLANLNHITPKP